MLLFALFKFLLYLIVQCLINLRPALYIFLSLQILRIISKFNLYLNYAYLKKEITISSE